MKLNIYSVRDDHVGFGSIFCEANDYAAKRGFMMAIKNPGSILEFSPSDFTLFKVGEFDSETGDIKPSWPIECVMDGVAAHG